MMALLNRKRKKPEVEEVKDEEAKVADKTEIPSSKFRKLLGDKLGALRYIDKAEEERKQSEQSHLQVLHDMEGMTPYLFVAKLNVQAPRGAVRKTRNKRRRRGRQNDPNLLQIRLDLHVYMKPVVS